MELPLQTYYVEVNLLHSSTYVVVMGDSKLSMIVSYVSVLGTVVSCRGRVGICMYVCMMSEANMMVCIVYKSDNGV